ncbi:MAG: MoxR family ATPase [Sulfolobales archaeon]
MVALVRASGFTRASRRFYEDVERAVSSYIYVHEGVRPLLQLGTGFYIASYVHRNEFGDNVPMTLAVLGAPGGGKSQISKMIARVLDAPFAVYTVTDQTSTLDVFVDEVVLSSRDSNGNTVVTRSYRDGVFSAVVRKALSSNVMPVLILEEIDKVNDKVLQSLLAALADGYVTDPQGNKHPAAGLFIATMNTRKYDPSSKDPSEPIMDRFIASVEIGYPSHDVLEKIIEISVNRRRRQGIERVQMPVEAPQEYEKALHEIAGNPYIRRCVAKTVSILQKNVRGGAEESVAEKVRRTPGNRAPVAAIYTMAALSTILGDELDEKELITMGLVHALRHRILVVPGADEADVILEAAACACDRTSSISSRSASQQQGFFR